MAASGRTLARRRMGTALGAVLLAAASLTPGCYTTQLGLLRSGLDSLRAEVDTMQARDDVAYRTLADTRRDLAQQRDLLLSTRATSGSTMQELFDHMSRLEGKLDDVLHRVGDWAARSGAAGSTGAAPPVSAPSGTPVSATGPSAGGSPATGAAVPTVPAGSSAAPGPDPATLYDQATRDLTEGRYPLAQQGYRDFLARYPAVELAASAQYGLGECFFAQAAFDSALVAYGAVGQRWPKSDRSAAALYKVGLCEDRLGRGADAKKTFQDLVNRFPGAGEAGLASERLAATHH